MSSRSPRQIAIVAAGAIIAAALAVPQGQSPATSDIPGGTARTAGPIPVPLYSPNGPLNTAIAPGARTDEASVEMIKLLERDVQRGGFFILLKRWTTTVFRAEASTPRRRVRLTARWSPARRIEGVPIPAGARPDPSGDGSMTIIDPATSCEYDFWQAAKRRRRWSASWANTLKIDGPGLFPKGLSARGSGFALPAGVIWPQELAAGRIDHALIFSYSYPSGEGAVPPATESDGRSRRPGAIPEGARLQLDPSLDLDSLDLKPHERVIAAALQKYGMYLADWGGPGVTLYAVHPSSFEVGAYDGLLPDKRHVQLRNIPVERFRVLEMPRPVPNDELPKEIVPSGCAEFG